MLILTLFSTQSAHSNCHGTI